MRAFIYFFVESIVLKWICWISLFLSLFSIRINFRQIRLCYQLRSDVIVVAVARVPFDTIKMENYYLESEVCPIAMNDDVKWWRFNRYIYTTNEMRQHPTDDGLSKMRE